MKAYKQYTHFQCRLKLIKFLISSKFTNQWNHAVTRTDCAVHYIKLLAIRFCNQIVCSNSMQLANRRLKTHHIGSRDTDSTRGSQLLLTYNVPITALGSICLEIALKKRQKFFKRSDALMVIPYSQLISVVSPIGAISLLQKGTNVEILRKTNECIPTSGIIQQVRSYSLR